MWPGTSESQMLSVWQVCCARWCPHYKLDMCTELARQTQRPDVKKTWCAEMHSLTHRREQKQKRMQSLNSSSDQWIDWLEFMLRHTSLCLFCSWDNILPISEAWDTFGRQTWVTFFFFTCTIYDIIPHAISIPRLYILLVLSSAGCFMHHIHASSQHYYEMLSRGAKNVAAFSL